ncbi:GIY-YIG nuclease family protein [Rhodococcus sp. D2-41]|uniref:GIY-YIG nuclease family protein n=1 Tax=Speluncibacter jeojiensis TaxID=2710754 RepID=UPI00240F5733|nr:GIY-YIG nuclease family protein [Rhodococcus sp. D2-41]MDG3012161.1 GIY-YIG nuclease family protein [Rhodococcus sp. D2-41]
MTDIDTGGLRLITDTDLEPITRTEAVATLKAEWTTARRAYIDLVDAVGKLAHGLYSAGEVYYARIGDRIKIGYSKDVRRRMRAYPPDTQLLAVHPGSKDTERQMHHRFAHCLADGREWFTPDTSLADHIESVVAEHGEPTDHIHKFRRSKQRGQTMRLKGKGGWAIT